MMTLTIVIFFLIHQKKDEVLNCAEAGVLGVLPGIIGTMMANETIKLITGIGEPLIRSIVNLQCIKQPGLSAQFIFQKRNKVIDPER